jgi:hypothetical protein
MQKTYRDLERAGEVGGTGFQLSAVPRTPLEELPEVASALAEFTRKNGKELADWTPDSISKRIEAVRRVYPSSGMSLSAAVISIYRHASEFLHGTYFSVLYFWTGLSGQKVTKESFFERWNGHFVSVFGALFFSASAVIELFAEKYEAPAQLLQTQKRLLKGALETLEMMNEPNTGPASVFVDVTDL